MLGAQLAAKSPPDGYTLFLGGVGSHAVNPNLHAKLPYDPVKDFAPITLIASAPSSSSCIRPCRRGRSRNHGARESEPRRINYASNGNGSSAQLAAVLYESMAGVQMVHVPYKGSRRRSSICWGRGAGDVQQRGRDRSEHQGGQAARARGHRKAARGAATGSADARRAGVPGYEAGSWYGILAPAGTPQAIVAKLHEAIVHALAQPEVRERLVSEGAEVIGGTPEAFAAHIAAELARMGKLIRVAGIRME